MFTKNFYPLEKGGNEISKIEVTNDEFKRFFNTSQKIEAQILLNLIEDEPNNPKHYFDLGELYHKITVKFGTGETHERTMGNFNKVLELDAGYVEAYEGRGWSYLHQMKFKEAYNTFQKAAEIKKSRETAIGIGWANYGMGKYDEAIKAFELSTKIKQTEPRWIEYGAAPGLGIAYYRKGNFEEAEKILKIAGENPVIKIGIISSYLESGNKAEAQKLAAQLSYDGMQKTGFLGAINLEVMNCINNIGKIEELPSCINHDARFGIVTHKNYFDPE